MASNYVTNCNKTSFANLVLFLYPMPWLALGILLVNGDGAEILAISNYQLPITHYQLPITLLTICLSAIVILQHYNLRRLGAEISECPTKYW